MDDPVLFDAVLFDLDGTLVATDRFWLQAARTGTRAAFDQLGLGRALPTPEEWMSIVGLTSAEGFPRLFPELSQAERDTVQAACEAEQARLLQGGRGALMPGAPQLLARLQSATIQLGIASNCSRYYLEQMQRTLGLATYFEEAYCIDTAGISDKGDMLERLLFSFETRSAIMVGDRSGDRRAAWENGLPAVHCAFGFSDAGEGRGAEATIADLGELWAVLQRRARWMRAVLEQVAAWPGHAEAEPLVLGISGGVAAGKSLFARDVVRLLALHGHSARQLALADFRTTAGPAMGPGDYDLLRLDRELQAPESRGAGYVVLEGSFLHDPSFQSRLDRCLYLETTEEVMWRRLSGLQGRQGGVDALSRLRGGVIRAVAEHRAAYDPDVLADLVGESSNPLGPERP